jgi:hypothetical protein
MKQSWLDIDLHYMYVLTVVYTRLSYYNEHYVVHSIKLSFAAILPILVLKASHFKDEQFVTPTKFTKDKASALYILLRLYSCTGSKI